jgi:hypothetical protein
MLYLNLPHSRQISNRCDVASNQTLLGLLGSVMVPMALLREEWENC